MDNREVIKLLNKNRACISMDCNKENAAKINNAIDIAIKALEVVDKIKKVREAHEFPEYFEEDVLNILEEAYGKE